MGKRMTVSAEVAGVVGPAPLEIAGERGPRPLLLVSAPKATAASDTSVVRVTGTVRQCDAVKRPFSDRP